MYSDIWLPDLDSEKWLSSLFSIRLNWNYEKIKDTAIYNHILRLEWNFEEVDKFVEIIALMTL